MAHFEALKEKGRFRGQVVIRPLALRFSIQPLLLICLRKNINSKIRTVLTKISQLNRFLWTSGQTEPNTVHPKFCGGVCGVGGGGLWNNAAHTPYIFSYCHLLYFFSLLLIKYKYKSNVHVNCSFTKDYSILQWATPKLVRRLSPGDTAIRSLNVLLHQLHRTVITSYIVFSI